MVWIEYTIWELANLLELIKFSFLCEIDQSSSHLTGKRRVLSILFRNLRLTKKKWALQIFREWQGQRANKICTIELGGVFKGEDIGLDVQELTESIENMNPKSFNYWLCKFVQEVANKSGGR